MVEYPYVLALLKPSNRAAVYFVTVEAGMMFNTCMLCAFDSEGVHLNFGPWESSADSEAFLARALEIATSRVKQAPEV